MKKLIYLLMLLAFAVPAFADIPPPKPTPSQKKAPEMSEQMQIEVRRDIKEACLIIPKSIYKQLSAGIEKDEANSGTAASASFSNLPPTQTIFAGLLMSLAFVFGGVWFVRSAKESNKASRAAVIFAFLFVGGAIVSITSANAPPPMYVRGINSDVLSQRAKDYGARGEIKIEVSEIGNQIILELPAKSGNQF